MRKLRRRIRSLASARVVGERIRFMRYEHGLSQRELARLCMWQQSHLSECENGLLFPSWRVLWCMSELFNISMDWFLEPTDHRSGKTLKMDQQRPEWMRYTDLPA